MVQKRGENDFVLGAVQLVEVEPQIWVAKLIGQRDIHKQNGVAPIRYEAVETALSKVAKKRHRK
jgi:hypothetical protein